MYHNQVFFLSSFDSCKHWEAGLLGNERLLREYVGREDAEEREREKERNMVYGKPRSE